MLQEIYLNQGWTYKCDEFKGTVDIPHAHVDTPLNYFCENDLWKDFFYQKDIDLPQLDKDNLVYINFDGISSFAKLFINEKAVGEHFGAYLPFSVDITEFVKAGKNSIKLECSSKENPLIPPFGFKIDYLVFGGMYREAKITIVPKKHIKKVFASGSANKTLSIRTELSWYPQTVYFGLRDAEGTLVANTEAQITSDKDTVSLECTQVKLWDIDNPVLYSLETTVENHRILTNIGFRDCSFRSNGFFLNGNKIKLVGLDRHQSYPYKGYAMPGQFQRQDAVILKKMGLNLVRCSHYPQHPDFLDECDKIGLLVFEEIPGWQHISDSQFWRELCIQNTREMIIRDYNHPSIILWGVRINESPDCDELYEKTNAAAHELDSTRQTGGVRNFEHSHLLEDVYTFNDFVHTGDNRGLKEKKDVTASKNPLLVTEFSGHMYSTKREDDELHRTNHALRYARILDDMYSFNDHCGCIGWCFADYNTHSNFGSGDMICYHGVTDMFRIPKFAAYIYPSQHEDNPVLAVSSFMDWGDHSANGLDRVVIFTNADWVNITWNGKPIGSFYPDRKTYPSLPHPPIVIKEELMYYKQFNEKFPITDPEDRKKLAHIVYNAQLDSFARPLTKFYPSILKLMAKYHLSQDELFSVGYELSDFNPTKKATWRFEAIKDNQVVKVQEINGNEAPVLEIQTSQTDFDLESSPSFQVTQINLIAKLPHFDNPLPYMFEAFNLETEGTIELYGTQSPLAMTSGAVGVYVRTNGNEGEGKLKITSPRFGTKEITFNCTRG